MSNNIIISSKINVDVIKFSYFLTDDGKPSSTVYEIEVTINNNRIYYVNKVFKEFDSLNDQLRKKYANIPELPSRHVGLGKNQKLLENRRQALNIYLKKLVDSFGDNLPIELVEFLQLNGNQDTYTCMDNESCVSVNTNHNEFSNPLIAIQDIDIGNSLYNSKDDVILQGVLSQFYN